ncbi:MAG: peroxiredoxin (alkyl hydroperoxide reductase subunit C) [Hyphomicrobiaceae bacterium]|jgi:peroxiredoxin (alkyl hydroperoxide reductase subunit C)
MGDLSPVDQDVDRDVDRDVANSTRTALTNRSTTPMSETPEATASPLPRLLEPAPQFEAVSTFGPIKLSDYKGKWVVLFSHPADFTPVCTTELMAFAKRQPAFEAQNAQLLGLSIDSIFSHIAWTRNIKDNFDVEIGYPLIADLDMKVASLYGMVHPGASSTATVRCVFIIDPDQNMRAMVYYPLTNGRSIDEIQRILTSLQTSSEHGVATPEGWQKGDMVIQPPPQTVKAAAERVADSNLEVTDWYFSKKAL